MSVSLHDSNFERIPRTVQYSSITSENTSLQLLSISSAIK